MALRYWTDQELERARKRGAEMAAWFAANQAPCLHGCLCSICGADPAKQAPPTSPTPKGQDAQKEQA